MSTSKLFSPFHLRSVTFRNRIGVSPMCQYSCKEGLVTPWHLVHLGSRAIGGAGMVMAEASAVSAEGRISPADAGIWSDDHVLPWQSVTRFIREQGAVPAIQLAHAGWKASTDVPWRSRGAVSTEAGGWQPVGVGTIPFSDGYPVPRAMTIPEIEDVCAAWKRAAGRACAAGFEMIEIHAAHGYLLHSFLSPISNTRTDEYGGSFENRIRFTSTVVRAVRSVIPDSMPLSIRLSCSDWIEGGWSIDETVQLARVLKDEGIDIIDCSSGGISSTAKIPVGPGYQVPFAVQVRKEANLPTAAVGMITDPKQAEQLLVDGAADIVLLAREMLRDPYWPRRAAVELGVEREPFTPEQYARAW